MERKCGVWFTAVCTCTQKLSFIRIFWTNTEKVLRHISFQPNKVIERGRNALSSVDPSCFFHLYFRSLLFFGFMIKIYFKEVILFDLQPLSFSPAVVGELANKMLGFNLTTKQTPKEGVKVKTVSHCRDRGKEKISTLTIFSCLFLTSFRVILSPVINFCHINISFVVVVLCSVLIVASPRCLLLGCTSWCYGSLHKLNRTHCEFKVSGKQLFLCATNKQEYYFLCSHAACRPPWKQTFSRWRSRFSLWLVCVSCCLPLCLSSSLFLFPL